MRRLFLFASAAFVAVASALSCSATSASSCDNATLKSIYERSSVRSYKSDLVARDMLVELVKAGMAAPSAMNRQPWEFIVIEDRATLDKLGSIKPPVGKAPAAIVVLGNTSRSGSWVLDCSAATQNILLAATSMGLGTVWTGAYGNERFEALLKQTLSLPDGVMPLSVIAVGYGDGEPTPKDKFDASKLFFDSYGNGGSAK